MFENGYEFTRYLTPLLKDFDTEPVLMRIKKPQANAPVERLHQVVLNMLVTKDLYKKGLDYIYT